MLLFHPPDTNGAIGRANRLLGGRMILDNRVQRVAGAGCAPRGYRDINPADCVAAQRKNRRRAAVLRHVHPLGRDVCKLMRGPEVRERFAGDE